MKKYISIILASVFLFACSPPDPGITSDIQVLNPGETYNTHVGKINSNFSNLNTDKLEDAPSDGSQYARQDGAWSVITAGGGAVDSVFGRTGAVTAESGDYASFYLALASCTTSGQVPKWDGSTWACGTDEVGSGGAVDSVFGRTGDVVAVGTDYASYYEALLTGCTTGQIKKWNGTAWECGTDETGSGSLPPGNTVNDILQWDGADWIAQGFINGLIDDTAGDGDTTAVLSASEVNARIAAVNEVPAGGTTGQVLGKASDTDNDVAWIDQTGSGGGVTSIIAGTNITIDPASGLGDVTINAATDSVGGYVPVPTNSDSTCTEGQYAIDRANNYIYWCYAADSWDRVPSTFDQWDNPSTVYYTLTVNPVPVNGRVIEPSNGTNINCGTGGNSCEADYETGTDAVFTAVPESGYTLDSWSGTNLTDNGDGTATVHIDQDISDVTASFIAESGDECEGKLVCQNFEGVGFDNGESWTIVSTTNPADPDNTTDPLRGSEDCFTIDKYGQINTSFTAASHLYGHVRYLAGGTQYSNVFIELRNGSTKIGTMKIGNGEQSVKHGTLSNATTSITISDGTEYHMWFEWITGSGTDGVFRLWIGTDTTRPSTVAVEITNGDATLDVTRFDIYGAADNGHIDQILLSDTDFTTVQP